MLTYEYDEPLRSPGFQLLDVGSVSTVAPVLPAGQWKFLAATYDGAEMKLYIDGAVVSSVTGPGASILTNDQDINIGRNGGNFDDWYKGIIDDVRIYNRALSSAEILRLFNAID